METANLNIKIDKEIKDQAKDIFGELGLDMKTAINMFLKAAIGERGIPFELEADIPNETTEAAIEEGERLMSDPNAPRYSSIEDLESSLEE